MKSPTIDLIDLYSLFFIIYFTKYDNFQIMDIVTFEKGKAFKIPLLKTTYEVLHFLCYRVDE